MGHGGDRRLVEDAVRAGDDVAHDEIMAVSCLGVSEWGWRGGLPPSAFPHSYFSVSGPLAQPSPLSDYRDQCVRSDGE